MSPCTWTQHPPYSGEEGVLSSSSKWAFQQKLTQLLFYEIVITSNNRINKN